jgi:hypothetical protein
LNFDAGLSSFVSFIVGACVIEKKPEFIYPTAVNSVSSIMVLPGPQGVLERFKVQVKLGMKDPCAESLID